MDCGKTPERMPFGMVDGCGGLRHRCITWGSTSCKGKGRFFLGGLFPHFRPSLQRCLFLELDCAVRRLALPAQGACGILRSAGSSPRRCVLQAWLLRALARRLSNTALFPNELGLTC